MCFAAAGMIRVHFFMVGQHSFFTFLLFFLNMRGAGRTSNNLIFCHFAHGYHGMGTDSVSFLSLTDELRLLPMQLLGSSNAFFQIWPVKLSDFSPGCPISIALSRPQARGVL